MTRGYRVTVHCGNRSYSEVLDMEEEKQHWDEAEFVGRKPSWEEWTRPLKIGDEESLEKLAGNHLIFGFFEGLWQSDRSPFFCLTEFNDKAGEWSYEFD